MGIAQAERTKLGMHMWPLECAPHLGKAVDALRDASMADPGGAISALRKTLDQPQAVSADVSDLVERVYAATQSLSPGSSSANGAVPPKALTVDDLMKIASLSKEGTSLGRTFTEDNPGLSMPILIDEKSLQGGPLLCVFQASDERATCHSLTELRTAQDHGLRLLGTSDPGSKPLIFSGNRGSEGIYVSGSGAYVDRLYSYGGYSKEDGSVALLGWDERERKLLFVAKTSVG